MLAPLEVQAAPVAATPLLQEHVFDEESPPPLSASSVAGDGTALPLSASSVAGDGVIEGEETQVP